MRTRKKKHGVERLEAVSELFLGDKPEKLEGIYLEIGCGKGNFIVGNALKYPERRYVAVERVRDVVMLAAEKVKANGLTNVRFINCDAKELCERLGENAVEVIYLNFSDPWPKARHYKRRLTYRDFLAEYAKMLRPGGKICFKTDNAGLFEFSLSEFAESGWKVDNVTYDLHNGEYAADNIMTEYEKNFSEKGMKIHRLEAYPPEK